MKAFLQEYGFFIVASIVAIGLLAAMFFTMWHNKDIESAVSPPEESITAIDADIDGVSGKQPTLIVKNKKNNGSDPNDSGYVSNGKVTITITMDDEGEILIPDPIKTCLAVAQDSDGDDITEYETIKSTDAKSKVDILEKVTSPGVVYVVNWDKVENCETGTYRLYFYIKDSTGTIASDRCKATVRKTF